MTVTKALDAILDAAEADLACAAIRSVYVDAGCDETRLNLDRVRPYCRELRAALAELDKLESADNVDKARANCRDLRAVIIELNPSAAVSFHCEDPTCSVFRSPRTTCWVKQLEALIAVDHRSETVASSSTRASVPTRNEAIHQSDIAVSAQNSSPKVRP